MPRVEGARWSDSSVTTFAVMKVPFLTWQLFVLWFLACWWLPFPSSTALCSTLSMIRFWWGWPLSALWGQEPSGCCTVWLLVYSKLVPQGPTAFQHIFDSLIKMLCPWAADLCLWPDRFRQDSHHGGGGTSIRILFIPRGGASHGKIRPIDEGR